MSDQEQEQVSRRAMMHDALRGDAKVRQDDEDGILAQDVAATGIVVVPEVAWEEQLKKLNDKLEGTGTEPPGAGIGGTGAESRPKKQRSTCDILRPRRMESYHPKASGYHPKASEHQQPHRGSE